MPAGQSSELAEPGSSDIWQPAKIVYLGYTVAPTPLHEGGESISTPVLKSGVSGGEDYLKRSEGPAWRDFKTATWSLSEGKEKGRLFLQEIVAAYFRRILIYTA